MSNDKQTQAQGASATAKAEAKAITLEDCIDFARAVLKQRFDKPLTYDKRDGSTGSTQIIGCTELGVALGQLAPHLFNDDEGCPIGVITPAGVNKKTGKARAGVKGPISGMSTIDNVTPVKSGRDKRIEFYNLLKSKGFAKDAWIGSPALADPRYTGTSSGGMKDDTASVLSQWLQNRK